MSTQNIRQLFGLGQLFEHVDQLKDKLDTLRPLPHSTLQSLREKFALDLTYHSNAIEGNTLTLKETKIVIEHGLTIGGKTMREHLEAINHHHAIDFIEELASSENDLTQLSIKQIHQLVIGTIESKISGVYRSENVAITGTDFIPTHHLFLQERMDELIAWHQTDAPSLHPIQRAAELHTRFVSIHPFMDGNGRTARLLLNLELIQAGYPLAVIAHDQRSSYYDALDDSHATGNHEAFVFMVAQALVRSLDFYLQVTSEQKQDTNQKTLLCPPFSPKR